MRSWALSPLWCRWPVTPPAAGTYSSGTADALLVLICIVFFASPVQEEAEVEEGEAEWGASFSSTRSQAERRPLLRPEDSSRGLHPQQHPQQQQQHFAPLDFDTALPSYPSDAAFSLAESAGGGAPAAAAAGSGVSLALSASEPDLPSIQPPLEAVPGSAAVTRPPPRQAASAATTAASAGVPPAAMHLPHLRLGRLSAPPSAAAAALMSPRGMGRAAPFGAAVRPLGALAADAAAASEALGSPRSMHGLVRTSLLPASADRQAVLHVGELLSADGDPSPAACSGAGSPPAAAVSANQPPPAVPFGGQRPAAGRGASHLLRHSGSDHSRLGGSSGGRGAAPEIPTAAAAVEAGGRRSFSGMMQAPSAGLAGLLKPPSPGMLSHLGSAANSPEPADPAQQREQPLMAEGARDEEDLPPLPALELHAAAGPAEAGSGAIGAGI